MPSPRALAVVVVMLALVSCKAPLPPEAASPTRAPELAASAEAFTPSEPTSTAPTDERTSTEPPPGDPPGTPSAPPPQTSSAPPMSPAEVPTPGTAGTTDPERRPAAFRIVGSIEDPAGDQGLEGPDHADIRRVTVEDDGRRARIRVEVAATLPTPPDDPEVIGLGVDLLEQDSGESAYQLFADGGSDGWFAYLQTPEGFVEYPGQFRVGGAVVEFVIPWEAIGSPTRGPFSGFLDWSRERPVANAAASDRAPDSGDASFDR